MKDEKDNKKNTDKSTEQDHLTIKRLNKQSASHWKNGRERYNGKQ